MIVKETIGSRLFVEQRTYRIYESEEDRQNDTPFLVTSDEKMFNSYKKKERTKSTTKKQNLISYLTISAALSPIIILLYIMFAHDFGYVKSGIIACSIYMGVILIGIPMFNYLEHSKFRFWISK